MQTQASASTAPRTKTNKKKKKRRKQTKKDEKNLTTLRHDGCDNATHRGYFLAAGNGKLLDF